MLKKLKISQGIFDTTNMVFSGKIKIEVIKTSEKQEVKKL